ncbi:MAG: hypothetical protein U9O64_03520 [Campylobacterota bacterium]|nr:hypothetical protein [Campylobacterota bacterium]
MTIKLYIGAHKTATTHIQSVLEANEELLMKNSIRVSTPNRLRPKWIQLFMEYCHHNRVSNKEELLALSPTRGTWIFSEENFVGNSYELSQASTLYPNILMRLKCFVALYPKAKIELYFSIRSYETFYRSTYLEVVRNRGYLPFNHYYKETLFQSKSWVNVIEMFSQVIPQENITLWCYEEIHHLMPEIINLMTELNNAKKLIKNYPIIKTRESLSQKSLEVLASLSSAMSQEESKKIVEVINNKYPLSDKYPKFIAFDTEKAEQFRIKYQQDIVNIKNRYPKIKFLKGKY